MLVTAGTGTLSKNEEDGIGLVSEHDYTILEMHDQNGRRSLLIKNPWSRAFTWSGVARHTLYLQNTEGLPAIPPHLSGAFWIDLHSFCRDFESIYLNWNPGLFSFRSDIHHTWHPETAEILVSTLRSNPQFLVSSPHAGIAWILLDRHIRQPRGSLSMDSGTKAVEDGYLSLSAFAQNGQRVVTEGNALTFTPFVNSPNTLLKLELEPDIPLTVLLTGQRLPRTKFNFSISVLATHKCSFNYAEERYKFCLRQEGNWPQAQLGSPDADTENMTERRFVLQSYRLTSLYVLFESEPKDLPTKITLRQHDSSLESHQLQGVQPRINGPLRCGPHFAKFDNVEHGAHLITCSTYPSTSPMMFSLEVGSEYAISIEPATERGAGQLVSTLPEVKVSYPGQRICAQISISNVTHMAASARWSSTSSLCCTLTIEEGRRPFATKLTEVNKGYHMSSQYRIATHYIDAQPRSCGERGLYLTLEVISDKIVGESEAKIAVQITSDAPILVGPWF